MIATHTHAQVTPEQVWQGWQKLSATYGQALVADSVTRQGDTLVVSGMKISLDQDGVQINGMLDEARFRDLGDGTVEVTLSDTYPLAMTLPAPDGATDEIAITITQPGLRVIAGGSAVETAYTLTAPSTTMAIQAGQNGEKLADITVSFTGLNGKYDLADNGGKSLLDSDLAVDQVAFEVAATAEDKPFDMAGTMAAVKIATSGTFLGAAEMENVAQALKDGLTTKLDFSYGAGDFAFNATDPEGRPVKVSATNQTGNLRFSLAANSLTYAASGSGVSLTIAGGNMPFPEMNIRYGDAGFDLTMPLLQSTVPAPFAFATRIVDLTVSDEIWAMFDPTAALPRDPATLVLETKGTTTLLLDIMDPAALEASGSANPVEINSLEVTNLTARAAGAALTGTGALTFDNTDMVSYDGIPAPTGKVDMVMTGVNGLIDKLVAMGLIPQQDVMGVRMMLAMVAKPGGAPDTLTSQVEFKDKGFFVNGARLQ